MKVLWILLAWIASAFVALAGPDPAGQMPFAKVGLDQGLPPGALVAMAQDRDGFLWFGSENGLLRYEGGQSRRWSEADGLPSSCVPRVVASPGGGVWAGTLRGLVLFKDGSFQRARFGGAVSSTVIGDMVLDRSGRLWAYSEDGQLVRQKSGMAFETLSWKPQGSVYGLSSGPRSGTLYVAGQFGVHAFLEDGSERSWGPAQGLPPSGPGFAMEDAQGRVWAGSGRTLVVKGPGQDRFVRPAFQVAASLSPNGVPYLDQDGSLWLPTQEGAWRITEGGLEPLRGLPFGGVRTLFRDREGSLWVMGATLVHDLGLGRVANFAMSRGGTGEVVWGMVRDGQGRMVAGTDNGAVVLGPKGPWRLPGTFGLRIRALALDRQGTLWMVSSRGPTLWWRQGRTAAEPAPLGEAGVNLNSVHVDAQGEVWLGSVLQGVLRWDPVGRRLLREVAPGFLQVRTLGVFEIHEDAAGRLWAGSDHGILVRARDGRWSFFRDPAGARVRGMAILPDGTAWVNYEEPQGIARVRLEGGQMRVLETRTREAGLPSDMVYAVRADPHGSLWVSTDRGFCRLEPFLHVGSHEGMESEDCSSTAIQIEEGAVWVGTSSGLVRYDTSVAGSPPEVPKAAFMLLAFAERRLEPPFGALEPLAYGKATLDFRVAAPTYLDPSEVRFQVRLLGLEAGWRDLVGNQGHFPSLAGGKYRFEVRAAQPGGAFGPVSGVAFVVKPPWWRTWWASSVAALSAFLALAGAYGLRTASLARSKAALETLVALRTQELSQRNEELTQALGNVRQLSGLLPICAQCKKIRDDEGYWNQLEKYFSKHSQVNFSHGLCPECAEAYYAELRGLQDKKKGPL